MALDLEELVPSLQRELSPPGQNLFPDATTDEFIGQLADAFWEGKLWGFFPTYTEADGIIDTIPAGGDDLEGQWRQLIVIFAGMRSIRLQLSGMTTRTRAKAGPVESDVSRSANLMTAILRSLEDRLKVLLRDLGTLGQRQTYYINGLIARQDSMQWGDEPWLG